VRRLIFAVLFVTSGLASPVWGIINGVDASADLHPSFVQILARDDWREGGGAWYVACGATHIGGGFLATAAHCLNDGDFKYNRLMFVPSPAAADFKYQQCSATYGLADNCVSSPDYDADLAGYSATGKVLYLGGEGVVIDIDPDQVIRDSRYNRFGVNKYDYDFALISIPELSSMPAMAIFDGSTSTDGRSVRLLGRGSEYRTPTIRWDGESNNTNTRQALSLKLLNTVMATSSECGDNSEGGSDDFDDQLMVCMGNPSVDDSTATGSCVGDSGGPAIDRFTGSLIGVTSFSNSRCAVRYSFYTDVTFFEGSGWIDYYKSYFSGDYTYPRELDFNSLFKQSAADLVMDWNFENVVASTMTVGAPSLKNNSRFTVVSDTCSTQTIDPGGVCSIRVNQTGTGSSTESLKLTINGVEESIALVTFGGQSTAERTLHVSAVLDGAGEISETISWVASINGLLRIGSLELTEGNLRYDNGCLMAKLNGFESCAVSVSGYLGSPGEYVETLKINIDGQWEYYRVVIDAQEPADTTDTTTDETDPSGSGSSSGSSGGGSMGWAMLLIGMLLVAFRGRYTLNE